MNEKNTCHKMNPVSFDHVKVNDTFWSPRIKAHKESTIAICLEKCEKTGRILNFVKAAGQAGGKFEGIYYNDSDVYKVLEGIAYTLINNPDPELEKTADEMIDKIAEAQEEDGYLDTYFTLAAPDMKFQDMEKHEDYCAGHLIEAAIAYRQATGKAKLLNTACRLADMLDATFGSGKRHWVTGHEEIELALVKLYHETGVERYLKLAEWFLEERGYGHGRGMIWDRKEWGPGYCQDDFPIREMSHISGHAVRAMYLYSGIADVAAVTGDQGYVSALKKLWDSVVYRNMYITGGIGSSRYNEGFTEDFDLPNRTAYCETCASVGMVYWNHRMFLITGESLYVDILERSMYNGALAGISLQGDKFFYVNPLESDGTHHREEWYECSCCPTQLSRFIPSIGSYIYAVSEEELWVNLYIAGKSSIPFNGGFIELAQMTCYPWDSDVDMIFDADVPKRVGLNLRFPGWCKSLKVYINNEIVENPVLQKGYIRLVKDWKKGDRVAIKFDMPVERVHAHPGVKEDAGRAVLQRGPLVYCLEEADNGVPFEEMVLPWDAKHFLEWKKELLGGVTLINVLGQDGKVNLRAIPYFAWDNREAGKMMVWIPEEDMPEVLYD